MMMKYLFFVRFGILLSLINLSCSQNFIRRNKRNNHRSRPDRDLVLNYEDAFLILERVKGVVAEEESKFLQIDNVIYLRSQKSESQLKACCDTILRDGISVMVNQVTRDLEHLIEARTHYFFLKLKNGEFHFRDCRFCC